MRKTTWRADYWSWPERVAEHPLRADALSGDEFASFLLGHPSSGYVDRNINPAYRNHHVALFLQDDWKVTPRFTINAGLRWDYEAPVVERYNRMVRGFAFDQRNPMAGKLPGSSLNGATIPRQQVLVAYPHFTSVTITDVPVGSQRYDSLQMKATRRFSGGLGMQISYTLSKQLEKVSLLNAQDAVLGDLLKTSTEKRLVEFDSPHAFVVLTTWELPVGRGKRLGSNLPRLLRGVVGNWNLNLQYTMRSGLPFAFPNAAPLETRSAKFTHAQRDALARQKGRSQFDPVFDVFFDTSLFPNRAQAPYTLRDFPTRFPDVRSKALNIWEISLAKDFPIRERLRFQLRADAQNAFNYPWFSRLQSADVTNPRFGFLNPSPNSEPREIILVAKLLF